MDYSRSVLSVGHELKSKDIKVYQEKKMTYEQSTWT